MPMTEHIDGVAVIGGGYAGLHAARAAARSGVPATVIDPMPTHAFTTRLAAVAGGTVDGGAARAPLRSLVPHTRGGRLARVDATGLATMSDGTSLTADAMVVTVGSHPTAPPLPGLDHLLSLRTADDALQLAERLHRAEAVVILGAGPTGVQLAGAAATAHRGLEVHLVEREERLLPGMHPDLGDHARSILEQRSVRVHTGTSMVCADEMGVVLDDDTRIDGVGVWAGGFAASTDVVDARVVEGRIAVDEALRIERSSTVFAAGDVAAHRDTTGALLPMSAQIAVQAGTAAGANAAAVVGGGEIEAAVLRDRGWVVDLGGGRGVADLGGVRLARPPLDRVPPLLHWAIDTRNLWQMAGLGGRHWLLGLGTLT